MLTEVSALLCRNVYLARLPHSKAYSHRLRRATLSPCLLHKIRKKSPKVVGSNPAIPTT